MESKTINLETDIILSTEHKKKTLRSVVINR